MGKKGKKGGGGGGGGGGDPPPGAPGPSQPKPDEGGKKKKQGGQQQQSTAGAPAPPPAAAPAPPSQDDFPALGGGPGGGRSGGRRKGPGQEQQGFAPPPQSGPPSQQRGPPQQQQSGPQQRPQQQQPGPQQQRGPQPQPSGPPQQQQRPQQMQYGPPSQQPGPQQQRGPQPQPAGPPQQQQRPQQMQYGPPSQQPGPQQQRGPQPQPAGPPQQQQRPQQMQYGHPPQQQQPQQQQPGPPPPQQQPQYGLPLQQPVQYGLTPQYPPPQQMQLPQQQRGPPPQQAHQPPQQQRGPFSQQAHQPPQQQRGPPPQQAHQPPQQQRGPPPQQAHQPPQQQRGPPPQQAQPPAPVQTRPQQPHGAAGGAPAGAPRPQQPQQAPAQKTSPAEQFQKMSLGSSSTALIPKRASRPQDPKKGQKFIVETNHLALSIKNPKMFIVHYDVSIVPDKPFRFYRPAVELVRQRCFPNRYPAFDGKKNLYAYPELNLGKPELEETVQVFDEERQTMKDITVTIKYAARVDFSTIGDYMRCGASTSTPQDAIQALDIVLRQPAATGFVTVGRSFFTKPAQIISLGDGLDLWYGFYQSAIVGWKPYLNIDVAHKGFPSPVSCLEVLAEVCRRSVSDLENPNFTLDNYSQREFLDRVKGLKVVQLIPNSNMKRTYKVSGISECPNRNSFNCEDRATGKSSKMTVQQYFLNTYKVRLRYPHLPCLKAGPTDKPVSLPLELCKIMEGQVQLKKLNENQTRVMVKAAAVGTDLRKEKIMGSIRNIKFNQHPCIREFGLSVADNFTKVEARVLAAPSVDYKNRNNAVVPVRVDRGVWRLINNKFLNAAEVSRWAIVNSNPRRVNDNEVRFLAEGLRNTGIELGLNISTDFQIQNLDQPAKIQAYFKDCKKSEVKLVIVILPDSGVSYATVKKMAELHDGAGILTQCLKTITVKKKCNQATFVNILLKINAKLDGVNHNITSQFWPDFFKRPVMVVGADVTHPAPDQVNVPSIAAVAASHDPKAFKYNMIWKLQPPRVEVIAELKEIMVEQLKFFFRTTRLKPEKILFYRDGVSEGQFKQILDVELQAIRAACSALSKEYQPKITFFVVQKRHHTRFFPNAKDADGKNKNVPAGTVVDTEITHPTELDFYMVSHASIQGTARPTKYHLLWDDSDMSEQQLEEITYYLCHLFTRCTRSVSYPAPTYYAHLAAFRARSYTEVEGNQRSLNLEDLQNEQDRRKISEDILKKNPMFFV